MPRLLPVMLVLAQVAGLPAAAAEFVPSWDSDGVWNSNVLRETTDEQSAFSLRTGPTLRVREREGDLLYNVSYEVLYEAFAQVQGINSFDQYAKAEGSWAVTKDTTIDASNDFAYVSGYNALLQTNGNISVVTPATTRVLSNISSGTIRHRFGSLWELSASVGNELYDYQQANESDTTATNGTVQLTHVLTPRLVAGIGGQYQRQEFSAVPQNPANGTTFYEGFGVLNYVVSPTWRITAQAGPSWAVPDQVSVNTVPLPSYLAVDPRTCPTNAQGTPVFLQFPQSSADLCSQAAFRSLFGPNAGAVVGVLAPSPFSADVPFVGDQNVAGSLNYFGRLTLDKDWRLWHLTLEYSRSASNSSGLATSTNLDQVLGSLVWTPTRLWHIELSAIYSNQTSVNDVRQREIGLETAAFTQVVNGSIARAFYGIPFEVDTGDTIPNALKVATYRLQLTGVRRISRRLTVDAGATYWEQTTSGVLQHTTTQVVRFNLGFTWTFDPIPL